MIKLHDRVKELSYVIGTNNITLSGAVRGFSTFSSCYSNNDILFYTISDGTNYELGSGLYLSSSNSIIRFPVKSTNNNNLVNFAVGTKEVYVNYPATNSVFQTSGINPVPQNSGLAFWTSSNSLSYSDKFVVNSGTGRLGINKRSPLHTIDIGGLSPDSTIRASGFFVGNSGIVFPSGNNGTSSYSGGVQLVHFETNQLSSPLSTILSLSGIVNQNILIKKQNANTVLAGPSGGCDPPCDPDYPIFRPLVKGDIPEEISNLTIGDQESNTFLTINLPQGLPDVVYRDINAISINTDNGIFAVNGLGQIKFATIDYSQVENLGTILNSVQSTLNTSITTVSGISISSSGTLNNRITALSGVLYSTSGILNNRVAAVSGYLDNRISSVGNSISNPNNNIFSARLSLSNSDSIYNGSGTSLYLTPHIGNNISLYTGSNWQNIQISSKFVSGFSSLDPNTIYDVFGYLDNNDINFELISWTMYSAPTQEEPSSQILNSYRSTGISKFQGVWCKTSDSTRRYIGTIRTGSSAFIDNETHRFICNHQNKIKKRIRSNISGPYPDPESQLNFSWIYNGGTVRKIPYIPQIEVINGLDSEIDLKLVLDCQISYARSAYTVGIVRDVENFYIVSEPDPSYSESVLDYINNDSLFLHYEYVVLYNTNGHATSDHLSGDYQDATIKTLTASINCKPVGYEKYYGIEINHIGSANVLGNNLLNSYGIMGTYEC